MAPNETAAAIITYSGPWRALALARHLVQEEALRQVVIVDTGGCLPHSAQVPPSVRVMRTLNYGYAGAVNLALQYWADRGAHRVLVMNDDVLPARGTVSQLCTEAMNRRVAAVVPSIHSWIDGQHVPNYGFRLNPRNLRATPISSPLADTSYAVESFMAAFVLFNIEAVQVVGGFDSNLFLWTEEVDWSRRALEHGYEVRCVPRAACAHTHSATVRSVPRAGVYFRVRNSLWMARRYGDIGSSWLLLEGLRAIAALVAGRRLTSIPAALRGWWNGAVRAIPAAVDDPRAALTQQRYETQDHVGA